MKVRYTPEAEDRFFEVLSALASVNPFAADRFSRKVERVYPRLAKFPRSGSRVREFPGPLLREFIVEPYRFFYFIDERRKTVWIVDVWHGAQLPAYPQLPDATAEP